MANKYHQQMAEVKASIKANQARGDQNILSRPSQTSAVAIRDLNKFRKATNRKPF
jgi:hypothetical protein